MAADKNADADQVVTSTRSCCASRAVTEQKASAAEAGCCGERRPLRIMLVTLVMIAPIVMTMTTMIVRIRLPRRSSTPSAE